MATKAVNLSRRNMLLGTGAAVAALGVGPLGLAQKTKSMSERNPEPVPPTPDQIRRMKWWHEAKFGMFIHFGLYSQHARHEWAMETEAIPIDEYMALAQQFNPKPGSP